MNERQQYIDKSKEETQRALKAAVMSFRIVELKECLKMFALRPSSMRKADLQKQIFTIIDGLRYTERSPPLKCYTTIMELLNRLKRKPKRRCRGKNISYRKQSVYGESPFFTSVQVLATYQALTSDCCVYLNISPKSAQLLRKKKSGKDLFTHEVQFKFLTEDKNDSWRPMAIRLKLNEKILEIRDSPPIIYITQYCLIGKNVLNSIEVELPDNMQSLTLVVSIVRRFSPSKLQDICPVKEVSKVKKLLDDYFCFNDNGERIYEVSLICPLSKAVMSLPGRGSFCKHPDVFDLRFFLERMQYFLFWKCPICECPVTYKTLEIDSFFKSFLELGKIIYTFYKAKVISRKGSLIEVITLMD